MHRGNFGSELDEQRLSSIGRESFAGKNVEKNPDSVPDKSLPNSVEPLD